MGSGVSSCSEDDCLAYSAFSILPFWMPGGFALLLSLLKWRGFGVLNSWIAKALCNN